MESESKPLHRKRVAAKGITIYCTSGLTCVQLVSHMCSGARLDMQNRYKQYTSVLCLKVDNVAFVYLRKQQAPVGRPVSAFTPHKTFVVNSSCTHECQLLA